MSVADAEWPCLLTELQPLRLMFVRTIGTSVRNPVKVIARSTLNVIVDSTVSDHLTERSDAGVRL